ncbi:hypothetical protein HDU87_002763 [Geranomyces variabilis]|uniref:Uncharacterized protein n=1 Tax=Geranomyces variabilis TaxID=109894 RepID=A0AAD5XU03_9FUNG|nr:hypothetical protein HDU87_002763 [Geranomyces variabilis]
MVPRQLGPTPRPRADRGSGAGQYLTVLPKGTKAERRAALKKAENHNKALRQMQKVFRSHKLVQHGVKKLTSKTGKGSVNLMAATPADGIGPGGSCVTGDDCNGNLCCGPNKKCGTVCDGDGPAKKVGDACANGDECSGNLCCDLGHKCAKACEDPPTAPGTPCKTGEECSGDMCCDKNLTCQHTCNDLGVYCASDDACQGEECCHPRLSVCVVATQCPGGLQMGADCKSGDDCDGEMNCTLDVGDGSQKCRGGAIGALCASSDDCPGDACCRDDRTCQLTCEHEYVPAGYSAWTNYWLAFENEHPATADVEIRLCDHTPVATVNRDFAIAARMEGTAILSDGRMLNLGSKECMAHCNTKGFSTGDFDCFEWVTDTFNYPYGLGTQVAGQPPIPLQPYISVASNDLPTGAIFHVPEIDGMTIIGFNGIQYTHNGCVRIDDVGWSLTEHHCDFFAFKIGNYKFMDGERPLAFIPTPKTTANCEILTFGYPPSPRTPSSSTTAGGTLPSVPDAPMTTLPDSERAMTQLRLVGTNNCMQRSAVGDPLTIQPCSPDLHSDQTVLINFNAADAILLESEPTSCVTGGGTQFCGDPGDAVYVGYTFRFYRVHKNQYSIHPSTGGLTAQSSCLGVSGQMVTWMDCTERTFVWLDVFSEYPLDEPITTPTAAIFASNWQDILHLGDSKLTISQKYQGQIAEDFNSYFGHLGTGLDYLQDHYAMTPTQTAQITLAYLSATWGSQIAHMNEAVTGLHTVLDKSGYAEAVRLNVNDQLIKLQTKNCLAYFVIAVYLRAANRKLFRNRLSWNPVSAAYRKCDVLLKDIESTIGLSAAQVSPQQVTLPGVPECSGEGRNQKCPVKPRKYTGVYQTIPAQFPPPLYDTWISMRDTLNPMFDNMLTLAHSGADREMLGSLSKVALQSLSGLPALDQAITSLSKAAKAYEAAVEAEKEREEHSPFHIFMKVVEIVFVVLTVWDGLVFLDAAVAALPELIGATARLANLAKDFVRSPASFGPEARAAAEEASRLVEAASSRDAAGTTRLNKGVGKDKLDTAAGATNKMNKRLICKFGEAAVNFGPGAPDLPGVFGFSKRSLFDTREQNLSLSAWIKTTPLEHQLVERGAPLEKGCMFTAGETDDIRDPKIADVCKAGGRGPALMICDDVRESGERYYERRAVADCATKACDHIVELQELLSKYLKPIYGALDAVQKDLLCKKFKEGGFNERLSKSTNGDTNARWSSGRANGKKKILIAGQNISKADIDSLNLKEYMKEIKDQRLEAVKEQTAIMDEFHASLEEGPIKRVVEQGTQSYKDYHSTHGSVDEMIHVIDGWIAAPASEKRVPTKKRKLSVTVIEATVPGEGAVTRRRAATARADAAC